MRTYFAIVTLAVIGFAALVVGKSSKDTYAVAGVCPPVAVAQTADAPTAEPMPGPKPFERPDLESQGAAELAQMTMDRLLTLSDDTLMTEVRNRLMAKRQRVGGVENMNEAEASVLRAEAFGLLLSRDGLLSLYSSPWGDYDATVAALNEVGATEMAAIMEKSLVVFGGKKPSADLEQRVQALDALLRGAEMSPFEELDQAALSLMPAYADKVAQYLRKHAERFDLPPEGSISRTQ